MNKYPNINYCWGSLMVEELVRLGVTYFCIAPGSRSAPLTVPIARHKKAQAFVHFDERGLAFHALGYVTATHKPAVLVCTSGTAVANFFPAIVEASKKKLPLIVLTADRPPELRQTGAVQTIDQVGIFGKYVLWQADMPCPDLNIAPEYVLTSIDQAMYQAMRKGGVVHINCMFRDPLVPVEVKTDWARYTQGIQAWGNGENAYTQYIKPEEQTSLPDIKDIVHRINGIKNGIIVVGKIGGDAERNMLIHFARRLGFPIFADISSGLRLGEKAEEVIHYYDQLLLKGLGDRAKIDGVIHFGGRITSKRYYEFVAKQELKEYVMILNHSLRNDPQHKVSLRVESTPSHFIDQISPLIKPRARTKFLLELMKTNKSLDLLLEKDMKAANQLTEPGLARLVSQLIPHGQGLFLSNSMPIRDMDMFADFKGHVVRVAGNRGASGIDGIIASASGYAQGLQSTVTVMIGDLAALHDLNSLAMLRDVGQPLIMIVLNNGGGGIFSFLPIAQEKDVFEKCFGTPHALMFHNAASMFELNYSQPYDEAQFKKAYAHAQKSKTSTIIEIISSREGNTKVHQNLAQL